jgi:ABC-type Fe3+-citrate transport system substrate-binding protein
MKKTFLILTLLVISLFMTNCSIMALFIPGIKVWVAEAEGKARLAEAESSKRITVLEAQAKLDSAKMLGDAEVARARGVAEANHIIGKSLQNNEAYLRYLWINEISNQPNAMYIATEGGLPILSHRTNK